MTYAVCKEIAEAQAARINTTIDTAYSIKNDFVFDNSQGKFAGVLPVVVISETGETMGLWKYLLDFDLFMDDMKEIDL